MQQASTFTNRASGGERGSNAEVIKKTYNDMKLSHFDIKKDVINLSETSVAKKKQERNNRKTVSWRQAEQRKMRDPQ